MLDKSKLPRFTRNVIHNYLTLLNGNVPDDIHLMNLNSALSQIACFNRVRISDFTLNLNTFPNIYTCIFADSGIGKDQSKKILGNILSSYYERRQERARAYRKARFKELEDTADERKMTPAAKAKYIKDNAPREMSFVIGSGTPEGLCADRELMAEAGFGSVHWTCSEFMDYIIGTDGNKESFASMFKEAFDNGDTEAKSIKSSQKIVSVHGVPMTIAVHSVVDSENQTTLLNPFFERGYARRCFVACPEMTDPEDITFTEMKKRAEKAKANAGMIQEKIEKIVNMTGGVMNLYGLTDGASEMYFDYLKRCQAMSMKTRDANLRGIADEARGRAFRMIKLSCIIAMQEHTDTSINEKDIEMAIYQTDYFAEQFRRFYTATKTLDVQKLFDFIISDQDKYDITKTVIRKQKFTPRNPYETTRWINDVTKQLDEYSDENGYILEVGQKGRAGTYYRLKKMDDFEKERIDLIKEMAK
jgi:hypothetical protein